MFHAWPTPPSKDRTPEEEADIERKRRELLAKNRINGEAALLNAAWWLDEYGYQDDDPVEYEQRVAMRELFNNFAAMWKGTHKVINLLAVDARDPDPTAGEIRKAMK